MRNAELASDVVERAGLYVDAANGCDDRISVYFTDVGPGPVLGRALSLGFGIRARTANCA